MTRFTLGLMLGVGLSVAHYEYQVSPLAVAKVVGQHSLAIWQDIQQQ